MSGDEAGATAEFDAFVAAHGAALARMAWALAADRRAGEDLLQSALLKVWRHWGRVRRADDPAAYVRRVLLNTARTVRRRRADVPAAEAFTDGGIPGVTDRLALERALRALPPKQRAVVVLRYLDDRSERETAALLGCSTGTVKSHTARALAALRRHPDVTNLLSTGADDGR